jgi:plastocyanin
MYSDTGIHGVGLIVNGQRGFYNGSTVDYGSLLSFVAYTSLAADAPSAGNLILTIKVTSPEGNETRFGPSKKPANPGDGVTWNVGSVALNVPGTWRMDFSLTSDVGGTQGLTQITNWTLIVAPPVLQPGPYKAKVVSTNQSMLNGQPVGATLTVEIEISIGTVLIYDSVTETYLPNETGTNYWNFLVPIGFSGGGSIIARVLDPNGNKLAESQLFI